jgi:hypothetical protein
MLVADYAPFEKNKSKSTTMTKNPPQKKSPAIKCGKVDEPAKTNPKTQKPQRNQRKQIEKNKSV